MRSISLLAAAAAALSMAAAPAFSAPANNPAAKLSLTNGNDQGGGSPKHAKAHTALIAGVAVVAVVAAAVALSHKDSKSASS